MADYRTTERSDDIVLRSHSRNIIAITVIAIVAIVVFLFASGFWEADVKEGALPKVDVKGGAMPDVDLKSKELVVGTKATTVDLPKIETKKTTIDVPAIGVKDNDAE